MRTFPGLPQSLFGRLMLALAGVAILTLLVVAALIMRERRDLAFLGTGAWSLAEVIAETSESLARMDPDTRATTVISYLQNPISTDDPLRPRRLPRRTDTSAVTRAYAARIQRELGAGFGVEVVPSRSRGEDAIRVGTPPQSFERDGRPPSGPPRVSDVSPDRERGPGPGPQRFQGGGRFLDVRITLPDGERVVFRTIAPQPGPPLPTQIFIELGLLTLVLAGVLYLMARTITRPLSDLAHAAESVGRGLRHAPLQVRGAREVQEATRAFNTMQERLQRYLDSRTRVLAAMSHDLRTPLTRLRLRAESIEDADVRARFTRDLDEMNGMVKGALALFRDLNDGETFGPVDLDALLRELKAECAETGGTVTVTGNLATPLEAQPKALKRCLANLLQNSIQYGARADVSVTDGDEVAVYIRDAGPGIPEELLEQVFEPFFRLEASRNRDTGGTGLGLCIARDIAQAHGGTLKLRNRAEGGLEATLILPRTRNPVQP